MLLCLVLLGCDEPASDCHLITGEGCPSGQRCGVYLDAEAMMHVGCLPPGGSGPGQACSHVQDGTIAYDTCTGRHACQNGRCERLCSEADHTPCEGAYPDPEGNLTADGLCMPVPSSYGELWPGVMLCGQPEPCSPFCQDCPNPEQMCLVSTGGALVCHDRHRPNDLEGEGATGDPCAGSNTCLPGHVCMADYLCYPFCDPTASTDSACPFFGCDASSQCLGIAHTTAGFCSPR